VREKRIGDYLRDLPARGIVRRAEVGPVIGTARLTCASTWVAAHHLVHRQTLYPEVEGLAWRHVLEHLLRGHVVHASGVAHDLGNLPTCGVSTRPEVRPVRRTTRFSRSAARISTDYPPGSRALDIHEEWAIYRHVLERLVEGDGLVEACCVRDYLGKLPACHLVVRAECAVGVSTHHAVAGEAHYLDV